MVYDIVAIVRMGGLSGPRVLVAITKLNLNRSAAHYFPISVSFTKSAYTALSRLHSRIYRMRRARERYSLEPSFEFIMDREVRLQ